MTSGTSKYCVVVYFVQGKETALTSRPATARFHAFVQKKQAIIKIMSSKEPIVIITAGTSKGAYRRQLRHWHWHPHSFDTFKTSDLPPVHPAVNGLVVVVPDGQ